TITLVPPPMLTKLTRDEDRPAYLFHRPPLDGGPAALKGLKQHVADLGVSLSGTVSQFAVPAGTDIDLVGEVDKELDRAALRPRSAGRERVAGATLLTLADDHHGFRMRFPALAAEQDF